MSEMQPADLARDERAAQKINAEQYRLDTAMAALQRRRQELFDAENRLLASKRALSNPITLLSEEQVRAIVRQEIAERQRDAAKAAIERLLGSGLVMREEPHAGTGTVDAGGDR